MRNTHKPRTRVVAIDTRVWNFLSVAMFLSLSALALFWAALR
jgi:hypothetical protein